MFKVGVIRGGPSSEYEVSLKTGSNVIKALRDRHHVRDIFIDRQGRWHIDGVERTPERILPHVDVIFNAMHGTYGEDGQVQKILESHKIPYTGSNALASALGMNKWFSKKYFHEHDLLTPRGVLFRPYSYDDRLLGSVLEDFRGAVVVKPVAAGSSIGVSLVRDHESFARALDNAFQYSPDALAEEYLAGREATCGVVEGSGAGEVYALPPVEIRNTSAQKDVWGYEAKYADDLHELICPGDFSAQEKHTLEDMALRAHRALGLRHYSRSDFMVTPQGIYILETNTLPGITPSSLFPKALSAVGVHLHEFLDHVLELAIRK